MLRVKQLPTFDSVAAGRKAVCDLTLGLRYHVIWLVLGNNAVAANGIADLVDDITVKINGKPQRQMTGVQLNDLNGLNGSAFLAKATGTAGQPDRRHYLPIFFAEPWRKNQGEVPALAVRANGIESFQVEVSVKTGLAAPIVQGYFEFDYDDRPIGVLQKWTRQDVSAVGLARDILTLDKREFIESIHLFPTVEGTPKFVKLVKFTANGEEIRDAISHLENQALLLGREMVPDVSATPRYDLVFDYDDPINGALPASGLKEMTLKVEWNAAANGTMPIIVQRTGPPE